MRKEDRMIEAKTLKQKGFRQKDIAAELGICVRTVHSYLKNPVTGRKKPVRKSKLDPFLKTIQKEAEEVKPRSCMLLFDDLLRAGYTGKLSILRAKFRLFKQKAQRLAVIRFETVRAQQAQVDWKDMGFITLPNGIRKRLSLFAMTLGYSRHSFIRFTTSMRQNVLLKCHQDAFNYFGGIPKEILYDNMKTAFVVNSEGAFEVNRRLAHFAAHYEFTPLRCRVRRPQTKGKVERFIGFVESNLRPNLSIDRGDLDLLQEVGEQWLASIATRNLRQFGQSRLERFAEEAPFLSPLPETGFETRDLETRIGRTDGSIHLFGNTYSIPAELIGTTIDVRIDSLDNVASIFADGKHVRDMDLLPSGAHQVRQFPGDQRGLLELWQTQQHRKLPAEELRDTVVETRPPAHYDELFSCGVTL